MSFQMYLLITHKKANKYNFTNRLLQEEFPTNIQECYSDKTKFAESLHLYNFSKQTRKQNLPGELSEVLFK